MTNYVDKYESNMDKTFFTLEGMKLETFFPWNGMNLLDYEKKKVLIDNDDFKKTMELYKNIIIWITGSRNRYFQHI